MPEFPAYSGGSGAQIDTNPPDYAAIGDTFALGTTGFAADAGTQLKHGSSLSPDDHLSRQWVEGDFGFKAWTGDPWGLSAGQILPTSGTLYMVRLKNPTLSMPVSNVTLVLKGVGASLTFAACRLYDSALAKIGTGNGTAGSNGVTADQSTVWGTGGSNGVITMALTGGPFTITTATFLVGILAVGTTMPSFLGGGLSGGSVNLGLSAANSRFAASSTGQTQLPDTAAALTQATGQALFAAVS